MYICIISLSKSRSTSEKMKRAKQLKLWELNESSINYKVPVYIIHGKYDYQVSYTLSREYFDKIEAPDKAFYTFENSAHSPNAEEPERFVSVVRQIDSKN